jgi:hypothetical protein
MRWQNHRKFFFAINFAINIEKERFPPTPPYKEKENKNKILSRRRRACAREKNLIFGFLLMGEQTKG